MNNELRKGIHFDLDTEILKGEYKGSDWHNAYYDIRRFFEKNDFVHIQGTGYHSKYPMEEGQAMIVVYAMGRAFEWIKKSMRICTIADIPEIYDITKAFGEEG